MGGWVNGRMSASLVSVSVCVCMGMGASLLHMYVQGSEEGIWFPAVCMETFLFLDFKAKEEVPPPHHMKTS